MLPLLAFLLFGQQAADPRLAAAARTEREGWIVARLEGAPRDIGYQYGSLMAAEIDDAHRAVRAYLSAATGKDWGWYREAARRLFWSKVDAEYREEMTGQAEGLRSRGVQLDVDDVLAFNAHIELMGSYLPWLESGRTGRRVGSPIAACSAFVATGGATRDGKVVMGHNLWWDYAIGQRFRAILDVRPTSGMRFVMDSMPGFIHSGSDFAINSAGILLCETTITGFAGFDPAGTPEFVRMRKAVQYGKDLDDVVRIFRDGNNGGYANTWLMADTKTGEIGKLQLGLKNVVFHRSKDGAFYGANYAEDPKLIAEEVVGHDPDPKRNPNLRRKARWNTLLTQNRGAVDAELAKTFLADTYDEVLGRRGASGSTLAGRDDTVANGAVNAKVATSDSARQMAFWGKLGFADGSVLDARRVLDANPSYAPMAPFLRDMPSRPYVRLPKGP